MAVRLSHKTCGEISNSTLTVYLPVRDLNMDHPQNCAAASITIVLLHTDVT
jgi:hypothetical protein